jgi:hypothetical protein
MIVNVNQIQKGVLEFVEKEIATKANGIKKFGVYFFMPTIAKKTSSYIDKLREFMPDMFEGENVKLDDVYNSSKTAIQKSGQFEFMGIIFNETDIDKVYTYIKGTSIA